MELRQVSELLKADIFDAIEDKLIEANTELLVVVHSDQNCSETAKLLSFLSEGLQRN